MSNEKDQFLNESERCFFKTVKFELNTPGKGRRKPRYILEEREEHLWLVRYRSQSDLAKRSEGEDVLLGHAVLSAIDEVQARYKLIMWLHEGDWIESMELLSPDPLIPDPLS